jgi:hypothetical protein
LTFSITTSSNRLQRRAMDLIDQLMVSSGCAATRFPRKGVNAEENPFKEPATPA